MKKIILLHSFLLATLICNASDKQRQLSTLINDASRSSLFDNGPKVHSLDQFLKGNPEIDVTDHIATTNRRIGVRGCGTCMACCGSVLCCLSLNHCLPYKPLFPLDWMSTSSFITSLAYGVQNLTNDVKILQTLNQHEKERKQE